jgi:hypothetical protein
MRLRITWRPSAGGLDPSNVMFKSLGGAEVAGCCRRIKYGKTPKKYGTNEPPNSKVASTYVHAYRIADKIIQAKGVNKFLGSGGSIHCGIGNDFKVTENSIERKD